MATKPNPFAKKDAAEKKDGMKGGAMKKDAAAMKKMDAMKKGKK